MIGTTLSDLLNLKIFRNAKVLAGKDNLERIVSTVTVAEVPDIISWAKSNTLYLTTLYSFQDKQSQIALINGLYSKQASGLIIKTGRFLQEKPVALISEAKKLNFPVIEIEKNIRWSDLIRAIFERIIENESKNKLEERFINTLFSSDNLAKDELASIAEELGLNIDSGFFTSIILFSAKEKFGTPKLTQPKRNLILTKCKRLLAEPNKQVIVSWTHKSLIIIANENEPNTLKKKTKNLVDSLRHEFEEFEVYAAIGPFAKDVHGIRNSIEDARKIVDFLNKSKEPFRLLTFEEAEEIPVLGELAYSQKAKDFIKGMLGPLIEEERYSELLKTLETYFACDRNKVKTAEALMIHLNTLKYRIKKIEALLGKSLDNPETIFKLQLALKLHKLT